MISERSSQFEETWRNNLRSDDPEDQEVESLSSKQKQFLRQIILSKNKLSDEFAYEMMPCLCFDEHIRVIIYIKIFYIGN